MRPKHIFDMRFTTYNFLWRTGEYLKRIHLFGLDSLCPSELGRMAGMKRVDDGWLMVERRCRPCRSGSWPSGRRRGRPSVWFHPARWARNPFIRLNPTESDRRNFFRADRATKNRCASALAHAQVTSREMNLPKLTLNEIILSDMNPSSPDPDGFRSFFYAY